MNLIKIKLEDLSLQDALDLAILVEQEAQERYEEFNRQIGSSRSGDAGEFFSQMARNEAQHGAELKKKRTELFGNLSTRMSLEKLYQYQNIEAPEFDRAHSFMSTKQALLIALDCEQKAFDFFDRAAHLVQDESVRSLFNELKQEELHHLRMVKSIIDRTIEDEQPEVEKENVDEPSGL